MVKKIFSGIGLSFIGVLIAGGLLTWVVYKPGKKIVNETAFFGEKIDNVCVDKICVKKDDGYWLIDEKIPADEEIVDDFVGQLLKIKLEEEAAQNKDRFKDLGFDSQEPIVEANGKKLRIGAIGSDYESTYVLEDGKDLVYKTQAILNKEDIKRMEYFIKKRVTNLPLYQIKKINLTYGKKSTEIEDNDVLVEKIAHLTAEKFLPDFRPQNKDNFKFEIETEGETARLTVGKNQNKKNVTYWATMDEKYYFQIAKNDFKGILNQLVQSLNDFSK